MSIKKYLEQYRDSLNEIELLKAKIKKLENQTQRYSVVEASSMKPPYQKRNIVISHFDYNKKKLLDKYVNLLQKRKKQLLSNKLIVEEFIDKIPTSRLRLIFEYKYLNKMTWQQIAFKISNGTAESLRKEHDRFLKEKQSLSETSDLDMLY